MALSLYDDFFDVFDKKMNHLGFDFPLFFYDRYVTDPLKKRNSILERNHYPMDIVENESNFEINVDVPGLNKDDINIDIDNNFITISGNKVISKNISDTNHRIERRSTNFSRSFTLPKNIDADNVSASLDKGVLTVVLPKQTVEEKKKKITIN